MNYVKKFLDDNGIPYNEIFTVISPEVGDVISISVRNDAGSHALFEHDNLYLSIGSEMALILAMAGVYTVRKGALVRPKINKCEHCGSVLSS